jgi:hypothetical protein
MTPNRSRPDVIFVRFGDGPASSFSAAGDRWVWSNTVEEIGGQRYHRWNTWTDWLGFGSRSTCGGQLTSVLGDVLDDAEAGLLFELGADLVHVCSSAAHHMSNAAWCWCSRCISGGARHT